MNELLILDWIQNHLRSAVGDQMMVLITSLGDRGFIWIALGLFLCIDKKHRKTGLEVLLALALEVTVCNLILKPLIARPRPFEMASISLLIAPPSGYSFPSGHTASSFAAACVLLCVRRKSDRGELSRGKSGRSESSRGKSSRSESGHFAALALAFMIAFSRMYLYVHYPTDVLGGIIVGAVCALLACMCIDRREKLYTL